MILMKLPKPHHKAIGYRDIERVLRRLREVRHSCTMENSSFGSKEETEQIKAVTKLYRESWQVRPLDQLIQFLEARAEGKDCECLGNYPGYCFHNQKNNK